MNRFMALVIEACCILAGMFFFALGKLISDIFIIIATVVLGGGLIVGLLFNRCSSCGRSLFRHHIFIEYCPYCGEYL